MVKEGIVLGHRFYEKRIEVDKAKIETIEKLLPATSMKGMRSFLGHEGFYRSIKDFSIISKPLLGLFMHGVPFCFDEKCMTAFTILKEKLTSTPIVIAPDWELPFELMCDASDCTVEDVLGH